MTSIKKMVFRGVKWTGLASFANIFFSMVKISILTRYLNSSDFGLMAIVVLIVGFLEVFITSGLVTSVFHKRNISKKEPFLELSRGI